MASLAHSDRTSPQQDDEWSADGQTTGGGSNRPAAEMPRSTVLGPDAAGLSTFRLLTNPDYVQSLSTLIEGEIIPRLMIAHSGEARDTAIADIDIDEVEALAVLALQVEAGTLLETIDATLARGVTVDAMMVDLLAPTARLLGEFWDDDRCDFVEVTMALWRLQEVVRVIAARAPSARLLAAGGHSVLFASMPGDQHNFGAAVIDEVFRQDGWVTDRLNGAATSVLLKRISGEWFDIIGLTVSCEYHTGDLTAMIVALRNVSRNPRICILVGGPVFSEDAGRAAEVGADGTARDAKLALKLAADLVRVRERETLASR